MFQHTRKLSSWGAWVVQEVERPTLGFSSGHDLPICEFEPRIGLLAVSIEPASDPLSPSLSVPPPLARWSVLPLSLSLIRGSWVAQTVRRPTLAQVMISQSVSSSPASGSVLTAQPGACFRFCVSLSLCPSPLMLCLCFCLSLKSKH